MNNKKKVLLSSILTIVLCLSLVAGATFAMFTDESKATIAVTGGKIDLEAQIVPSTLTAYSSKWTGNSATGMYVEHPTTAVEVSGAEEMTYGAAFNAAAGLPTGGKVTATVSEVTVERMAPLDRITFDINVVNKSDIAAAYRIYILKTDDAESDYDLAKHLEVTFEHDDKVNPNDGYSYVGDSSTWTTLAPAENGNEIVESVKVNVLFPESGKPDSLAREDRKGDNQYQEAKCTLTFVVEAYQAYAKLDEEGYAMGVRTWLVANQTGLGNVAKICNNGDTIKLENKFAAEFATDRVLTNLTVKGADLENFTVNAPNAEMVIENNVINLNIVAIKDGTAVINGSVGTLNLTEGKAAIGTTGSVENFASNPASATKVTFVIPVGKTVNDLTMGGTGETVIDNKGTINSLGATTGTTTVTNTGRINGTDVKEAATVTINGVEVTKGIVLVYVADGFYRSEDSTNYYIYDIDGLKYFRDQVNGGDTYVGKTVSLLADIDLNNEAWTPIGKVGAPFNGTFDGQNHTISNLTCSGFDRVGLFGYTINHATIKNVNIDTAVLSGEHYAGAILGQGYASIDSCHVENVTVTVAPALHGDAYDNGDKAGAIVGQLGEGASMGIENCSAKTVTIRGYRDIGGIVGMAHNNNYLKNNTATDVTLTLDYTNGYESSDPVTVGGIYGREGTNVVKEGNSATDVKITVHHADGVDQIGGFDAPYTITNANGLVWFANEVNGGNSFSGKTVKLGADINLAGIEWTPIGNVNSYPSISFSGIFDGNGKTISNLTCVDSTEDNACAGLFGSLLGTVKNVKLVNVDITSSHYAGAVVAYASNCGVIENCHVDGGTIKSVPELIGSEYDNGDKVGGIAGYGIGKITGCSVKNVTVEGLRDVGGIIGYADEAEITGNTVDNVTLLNNRDHDYKNYATDAAYDVNEVIGKKTAKTTESGNTATDVTISYKIADGLTKSADGLTYTVSSADGFMKVREYLANGTIGSKHTVKLDCDIDMTGKTWTAIDCHADGKQKGFKEFDGQGYTISNLTINGQGLFWRVATDHAITIKNVTFDHAVNKTNTLNVSLITAQVYSDLTLDNVNVINSDFKGTYKVAPLVGSVYDEKPAATVTLTIRDCTVENCTVEGTSYNFDICGMVAWVNLGDNDRVVFEGNNVVRNVSLINRGDDAYNMFAKLWHDGGVAHNDDPNVTVENVHIVSFIPEGASSAVVTSAVTSASAGDTIYLPKDGGEVSLQGKNLTSDITVHGNGGTTLKVATGGDAPSVNADGVTFIGVTFDFGNQTYNAIRGTVTYRDCTFIGLVNSYDNSTFENCTFTNVDGQYLAHVYAGNATFTGCTFNGDNRCVYVYTDGADASATFTSCEFIMTGTPDKSAIMMNSRDNGETYTVVINNCTQTGGNAAGTNSADGPNYDYRGLYGFKHNPGQVKGTVTVDGTVVYSNPAN